MAKNEDDSLSIYFTKTHYPYTKIILPTSPGRLTPSNEVVRVGPIPLITSRCTPGVYTNPSSKSFIKYFEVGDE